jgi:glycosyltransferase involved in cell wall biosynthesis
VDAAVNFPYDPRGGRGLMQANRGGRIVFDVSTSMRWTGPPVGIVRAERELAAWAFANVPGAVFVFFDPNWLAYRAITCDVRLFLSGDAALDTFGVTDPARPGKRRTDRIPAALKQPVLWIIQTRRMALSRLERLRLETRRPWLARLADRLQRRIMSPKYRKLMVREDDTRRPFVPRDMAIGGRMNFARDDILVCAGSGWGHSNIESLSELKSRIGFRMVLLCHDLIPLMFPHFYKEPDVAAFRNYMNKVLAIADQIVVSSRKVEADCRAYCAQQGIAGPNVTMSSFGYDVGAVGAKADTKLPAALSPGQFALLVSTIEPRKGHRLLYRVWSRLIAQGVPQATGFKLVFAGRPGWMVDDLLATIRGDTRIAGQLLMIHDADDGMLAALYGGAAFCVYPSVYEGYGLPVIEAFSHGKAVLASNGGALLELAQGLSPCLDPTDEQAWYDTMRQWIESPQVRAPYEREIRARFRHQTWSEAAAGFFDKVFAANVPGTLHFDEAPLRRDGQSLSGNARRLPAE